MSSPQGRDGRVKFHEDNEAKCTRRACGFHRLDCLYRLASWAFVCAMKGRLPAALAALKALTALPSREITDVEKFHCGAMPVAASCRSSALLSWQLYWHSDAGLSSCKMAGRPGREGQNITGDLQNIHGPAMVARARLFFNAPSVLLRPRPDGLCAGR